MKISKIIFTALIAGGLTIIACQKDEMPTNTPEVPSTKMAFLAKKTATWCSPCGGWGWSRFEDISEDETLAAHIAVEMHTSGGALGSDDAREIGEYLEYHSGIPSFYVNCEYFSGLTAIKNAINLAGETPASINSAFTVDVIDAGKIQINLKTKVFEPVDGDFYLGVYLLEKGVQAEQNGHSDPNPVHKAVFREALSNNVMGDLMSSGTAQAGAEFDHTIYYIIDTEYKRDDLQIFLMLWKKVDNEYVFESAYTDFKYLADY